MLLLDFIIDMLWDCYLSEIEFICFFILVNKNATIIDVLYIFSVFMLLFQWVNEGSAVAPICYYAYNV